MRFGARGGNLPAAVFNMSRTDMAGIAILVFVAIFIAVLVKLLRD
ncbi:MAG: hypothetical protein ACHQ2Z_10795 [Elusimicrobiota bacterium]